MSFGARASSYAPAGGGWTPASFGSDLEAWVDFTDTSTITASSGLIDSITSKDPNGRTFARTGTARPATGVTTLNGHNVADFDGGDVLAAASAADWAFLNSGTNHLIGVLGRISSSSGGYLGTSDGAHTGAYLYKANDGAIWHTVKSTGATFVSLNQPAVTIGTVWRVITVLVDADNATAADRSRLFVGNGTALAGNTSMGTAGGANSYPLHLGSMVLNSSAVGYLMTGSLAAVVIVSGAAATEANRQTLRDYLLTLGGI